MQKTATLSGTGLSLFIAVSYEPFDLTNPDPRHEPHDGYPYFHGQTH